MRRAACPWVCIAACALAWCSIRRAPRRCPSRAPSGGRPPLARDVHGPRAILNAVERLIGSAATERDKAARDLAIAQGQRRDYEARLGAGFAHAAYLAELTDLRNQLEAALSSTAQEGAEASRPPMGAARRAPQSPARRPYPGRRPGASCSTPHGHGRRGDHHAHSPARAGGDRAPARRRAVPRSSHDACTAACHRAGTSSHACPGTARTLDASPAVAPVLGTDGWARRAPRCCPHPRGALRIAAAPVGNGWPSPPLPGACGGAHTPPWASSPGGVCAQRRAGLLGLHLALCGLSSLLERLRNILRGGSLASRPGLAALGAAAALTRASPPWLRGERREQSTNCRGPAAEAAEQSRSASLTPGKRGGSPGKPRCALAVTYPGRESQTRQELFDRQP